jgi:hypothetical protein
MARCVLAGRAALGRGLARVLGEPPLDGVAAFAVGQRRRQRTVGAVLRAAQAHVEVILVSPPGPHAPKPRPAPRLVLAQGALDRGVNEDAIHGWTRRRCFKELGHAAIPSRRHLVGAQIDDRPARAGRCLAGRKRLGRRPVPKVDIETALMAAVSARRRAAARLPQIAHCQQAQLILARDGRKLAYDSDQRRMAELTVPLGMHHQPTRPLQRKRDRALHAARAGLTDGEGWTFLRRGYAAPARVEGWSVALCPGVWSGIVCATIGRGLEGNQESKEQTHGRTQSARIRATLLFSPI